MGKEKDLSAVMLMKRLSGKMLRETRSDRDAIASCPDEVLCRQTGRITYNGLRPCAGRVRRNRRLLNVRVSTVKLK